MIEDSKLPRELVWDGAHVSDLGLTAIADGQEAIVPADAVTHAQVCEWCAGRLGRTALLSAAVGEGVREARPALASAQARGARASANPSPWRALILGCTVAVLAAVPSLPQLAARLGNVVAFGKVLSAHGLPVLVRGIAMASRDDVSRGIQLATIVASVLLVLMGLAIARTRSRASSERSVSS
ncbi:MAG TPA: hypothetical protein VF765_13815 [Polyangiaceae bacterium]